MIGPNAPICVPKVAQPVDVHLSDYEVELTIVIGKTAKNVSEAEALDYVLGYTAANDVRGLQPRDRVCFLGLFAEPLAPEHLGVLPQTPDDDVSVGLFQGIWSVVFASAGAHSHVLTLSGSPDNTTPLGPCIVSNNAIPDPQVLPLTCMLNGKTLQNGNTKCVLSCLAFFLSTSMLNTPCRDQIFNVRQTVAFLSQATTLEPGSIILTGTPAGVGFARKPAVVLKHGDDCRVWIGHGIGTLVNTVVEEGKRGAKL